MVEPEEKGRARLGVMIVGACGMTGSAVIAGLGAMKQGAVRERYGTTSRPEFRELGLPSATQMVFGGWDYHPGPLSLVVRAYNQLPIEVASSLEAEKIHVFPGLWTPFEYPLASAHSEVKKPSTLEEGAQQVADDIKRFKALSACDRVVVVFVGTPARDLDLAPESVRLAEHSRALLPSGFMYAYGAASVGAHFVDFTPSRTLECKDLWSYAEAQGAQIAGRDGSTGQTMLKATIAEMLLRRGISIRAWYSTNLIGNRDGEVLSHADYASAKLADKTDALEHSEVGFHRVAIEYCPPWGDRKEAWDAVECDTWLSAPLSIRIDWRGHDSQLAGAMIGDLVRLICLGEELAHRGFQPQLGFFFKRPLLREHTSISERWNELIGAYARQEN